MANLKRTTEHVEAARIGDKPNGQDTGTAPEVKLEIQPAQRVPFWLRSPRRQMLRLWFMARIAWPVSKIVGPIMCSLNRHSWQVAPHFDDKGAVLPQQPSDLMQCQRPECRVLRGTMMLLKVGSMAQTDEFMVLADLNCPACGGRGWSRRMLLPGALGYKSTVPLPCRCLKVHPRWAKTEKVKAVTR